MSHPNQMPQTGLFSYPLLDNVWDASKSITFDNPVARHFEREGIYLDSYPDVIRYHDALPCEELVVEGDRMVKTTIGAFPAMLAVVSAPDGTPVGVHRTLLTGEKSGGPLALAPRRMLPTTHSIMGGAVRLFKPTDGWLAIAESIEKALVLHTKTGLPVWAVLSNRLMESVVIPKSVRQVLICSELDRVDHFGNRAGNGSAILLRDRLSAEGRQVKMHVPIRPTQDCLDEYLRKFAA